ncbi:MAG: HAMP domain-containing protein [Nannocystaceae bacterium]|nr:HAMP domain-containing protein [Nannocystaceae bacterium]
MAEFGVNHAMDWSIIAIAPVEDIIAPVVEFRNNLRVFVGIAFVTASFFLYLTASGILKSVGTLVAGAKRIATGDFEFRMNEIKQDEFGYLASTLNITLDELTKAQFLGFDRGDALIKGLNSLGLSLTPDNFPVITGNQLVQWELTKRGVGVSVMTEEIGDNEPLVRRALPEFPPFPLATWLTTHRELSTSRRMRVVFDLLFDGLRGSGESR